MTAEQQQPGLQAPWRIGVDVGGTFTDLVLRDAGGTLRVVKVPSVPADPSRGVLDALARMAAELGGGLGALLSQCQLFVHGSTIGTNTLLERKGARVGMLTTVGFRDSLEIRRGIRENQWDHRAPFPDVLVPRYLRLPVRGRIDRDGRELTPLEMDDVRAACDTFAEEGVETVAICFLNSYRNPAHEQAAAQIVRRSGLTDWVTVSAETTPVMGEYERGSTAVINAYIAPKVVAYIQALDGRLRAEGLPHPILLVQSNGGAIPLDQITARPVNLVLSGPAAGVGALNLYRSHAQSDDLISLEIGGTSCDVTLMDGGGISVSDELMIDGYHLATPSVDIHTVGAGGGAIAWLDGAGMLRVGPQGAGADPGPACYGLGGEAPTVTDAHMVLGRIRPGPYGGGLRLAAEPARRAIATAIAEPLGLSVEEAAAGIIELLEQSLLHAVEHISIERGHDPARFTLVAAGGAGPMHGAQIGRKLGCRRVYVPRQAGVFCALGMLHSDIRQDYLRVHFDDLDSAEAPAIEAAFAPMATRAAETLAEAGFTGPSARLERGVDLRYRGQLWSLRVALEDGRFDVVAIRAAFEAEHGRQFGHIQPGGALEITALRVIAHGLLDRIEPAARAPARGTPEPIDKRPVQFPSLSEWPETPVYAGADLRPGHALAGPLLIEEETTTIVVFPGDRIEIDAADNIVIHIGPAGPCEEGQR